MPDPHAVSDPGDDPAQPGSANAARGPAAPQAGGDAGGEVIDVFCHWLPPRYLRAAQSAGAGAIHLFQRATALPLMCDLEARFRRMDGLPGYRQVPSLVSPPIEAIGSARSSDLARLANDEMAELVARHPDRFAGFVAALPLDRPDDCIPELERACIQLGAAGAQLFTNIAGRPLDLPWCLELLGHAAAIDAGIWLHPTRGPGHADYLAEESSKHELWWALGWPHETSLAMARLAFAGVFDRWPHLRVLTHHCGGTVPMLAGRFAAGMSRPGTRTADGDRNSWVLREPADQALRRFCADTASFGHAPTLACAADFFDVGQVLFASDMPFGHPNGWGQVPATLGIIRSVYSDPAQCDRVLRGNAADWLAPRRAVTRSRVAAATAPAARGDSTASIAAAARI